MSEQERQNDKSYIAYFKIPHFLGNIYLLWFDFIFYKP
jgi:hypothetical protein